MAGRLCGRCGGSLTDGGCGCPPTGTVIPLRGPVTDEPTTVIPVIGDPELVRPYITPTEHLDPDRSEDDEADPAYGSSVVPGIDAPHLVRSSRARVLAGQLADPPDGNRDGSTGAGAGGGAVVSGTVVGGTVVGSTVATRANAELSPVGRGPERRDRANRRRTGRGRRAALITAGVLAVAALGTGAALAPTLLNGDDSDQAQPQPGVTLAMPTAGPGSATAASHAPATVRPSRTTSAPAAPPATPSSHSTPSTRADSTPTGPATHGNAPNNAPTPSAPGRPTPTTPPSAPSTGQSLQLGDRGAAVATLQSELSSLWIDRSLPASGTYDTRTEQDVATFQLWYGVKGDPSGVFGPNSQARMSKLFRHH
jgi:hypothetical protein